MKTYPSGAEETLKLADIAGIYAGHELTEANLAFSQDKWSLSQLIRSGLPYSFFDSIQLISPFTLGDWAQLLNISYKSMLRYKQDRLPFKSLHSEKIIEIAEVTTLGLRVFGDEVKFKRWLDQPSLALGGVSPRTLLSNSYGKDLVMQELTAIEYGVFA